MNKYIGIKENKIDLSIVDPDLAKYLKKRANVTDADIRLHLKEVNFHCPICGKDLQSRNQKNVLSYLK